VRRSLLEILVDPVSGAPLTLTDEVPSSGDDVRSGTLSADGAVYPISDGIPRFSGSADAGQQQTAQSFGFKWTNRASFGSEGMRQELHGWLLKRYGFASADAMRTFFGGRRRILDAGCGAGFATSAWMNDSWNTAGGEWVGVDISAAIDVAQERVGRFPGTQFVQADILALPFRRESFDTIFSEGVLHHTPSTERAFRSLVPLLAPGGELMIYVYRTKAPIREFTDDYVRNLISHLSPADAWEALRPLTRLGQALAELKTEIEVVEDVPLLGIKAGTYDVQRLVYWNVAKLFWNEGMTFEENNHLNFDWYHPRYAHRQSEEEVRRWYDDAGLEITHLDADDAGYTVRGVRRR
jgi:arsenite methyltransferase